MNVFSPEEDHGIIERAHCNIWVVVAINIQTTGDGISKTSDIKVPTVQHLMRYEAMMSHYSLITILV